MTSAASDSSAQPLIMITNPDQIGKLEDVANMINLSIGATGKGILIGLLSALGSAVLICIVLACLYFFRYTSRGRILLDRMGRPGEYDDELAFAKEEAEALEGMDDIHRTEYMRAKAFIQANPPESAQTDISLSQFLAIQEKGVSAWEFEPELEVANCFVEGRTEIEFFDSECSVQSNLPVPKQNEVYYWEAKIYDKPESTTIGIGMTTKPYPLFCLPGYHKTSLAYLSPGERRFNQPFAPTSPYGPGYVRGDVIGVGYRPRTGTVFFTRNGKKLEEVTQALKTQNLFPTVGATGPCTVHVNFGQMGFVFIEANVKKWGLAPLTGSLAPPPPYGSEQGSILLDRGVRGGGVDGGNAAGRSHEAWQYAGSSSYGQHARTRSVQTQRVVTRNPRSPGPVRSPTDISLASFRDDADADAQDDDNDGDDDDDGGNEGASGGASSRLGVYDSPRAVGMAAEMTPAASDTQALVQGLGLGLEMEAPPPEYECPHEEGAGRGDDDERATDSRRSSVQAGDEERRRLLRGQGSPPIPSYDVAVGSVRE